MADVPPTWVGLTFQSTPPARGATSGCTGLADGIARFQSTPPARGATATEMSYLLAATSFQSTPPARGATVTGPKFFGFVGISIHAPREGGDSIAVGHNQLPF